MQYFFYPICGVIVSGQFSITANMQNKYLHFPTVFPTVKSDCGGHWPFSLVFTETEGYTYMYTGGTSTPSTSLFIFMYLVKSPKCLYVGFIPVDSFSHSQEDTHLGSLFLFREQSNKD